MRLLTASTITLAAAAVSLWPAAVVAAASARTIADLRAAAVSATILAGVSIVARAAVDELMRRERRHQADKTALIHALDRAEAHPSGPFRAAR